MTGDGENSLWQIADSDDREYPLGLTHIEGGIHISVAAEANECTLLLFPHKAENAEPIRILFPESGRVGSVWEITLKGTGLEGYDYAFEADGMMFPDPCGRCFAGHERWRDKENRDCLLKAVIQEEPFSWGEDRNPRIPYENCVVYCAHVRGLTMHASSGSSAKGTFAGIVEKIPYLKGLGITTLELLPVTEFQEVMLSEDENKDGKVNYWGYGSSYAYAPKAAYAGDGKNPVRELKILVKELHKNGMELVLQMHLSGDETQTDVLDVLRFWVRNYHLDGIHLTGNAPLEALLQDPYLVRTKIWVQSMEGAEVPKHQNRYFGEYQDGFMLDMRRVLRGDTGQMQNLVFRSRRNPERYGVLNYMANVNGFTLADMVSYEEKHNEANGEENRDGSDYNCTWNCGVEGPTQENRILTMRRQQMRNALLLLFLSQGTPVLMAGDEFGNSQNGNNNAYCQDNEISWLDWKLLEENAELYEFTRNLIAFRREHPVFHAKTEPADRDYLACGMPQLSYHGVKVWCPEFDDFRRQMGMLYCGDYAEPTDRHFYVLYNMYREPREMGLPKLPGNQTWHAVIDSSGSYNADRPLPQQKACMVPARTILVLMAG